MSLLKFIKNLFCQHKVQSHIYTCWQDRYVETKCDKCGKTIFHSL